MLRLSRDQQHRLLKLAGLRLKRAVDKGEMCPNAHDELALLLRAEFFEPPNLGAQVPEKIGKRGKR